MRSYLLHTLAAVTLTGLASSALATDGYFADGIGVKSQGQAGSGYADPQDALAGAINPAGTAWVGNRLDVGINLFAPSRGADISGNQYGANGSYDGNNTKTFWIPEFGYTHQLNQDTTLGLAVYGNGGMNTDYSKNPFGAFGGQGSAGVNLEQLFISPSVSWRVAPGQALGIGLNFVVQEFSAKGINPFSQASQAPQSLTNKGNDFSNGTGLQLGWSGEVVPGLHAGVNWNSRIHTGKFSDYQGLFAESGGFDVPQNFGAGLAWQATPALRFDLDLKRIDYSAVPSVGSPIANLFAGNPLGSSNGPGFGWQDITVEKLGIDYVLEDGLTLRAGYSHSGQPVPASQAFFNILAPGVVTDHLTAGFTWKAGPGELSAALVHGFNQTVDGTNAIPPSFAGGNVNLHLSENIVSVAYGWEILIQTILPATACRQIPQRLNW